MDICGAKKAVVCCGSLWARCETQERFKFNLMDEVEDRTTDCAAFDCHAF